MPGPFSFARSGRGFIYYDAIATQLTTRLGGLMSEQKDDTCQACLGTGAVAGAQPVRTGPFLLKPPPCRVCGGTGGKPQSKSEA